MRNILVGLPAIIFALVTAGYFSVYRVVNSANSNDVLPDWQTILFIEIPDLLTATILTQLATGLLLVAVLIGLTVEAYKIGSKEPNLATDKILIGVVTVIALAVFVILQSAFNIS